VIGRFFPDKALETRFDAIREANRRLPAAGRDEQQLFDAACEALCAPGGYRTALVVGRRPDGSPRLAASGGVPLDVPFDSLPIWNDPFPEVPAPFPVTGADACGSLFPVPVEGETRMLLLAVASSKNAIGPAESADLGSLAARLGHAVTALRLAGRLGSLRSRYDDLSAELGAERDFSTALLGLVPLPVLQLGPEGEVRLFNARCEALTGFRAGEIVNRRLADLLVPEPLRSDFRRLLVELFIGRRHGEDAAFPLLHRDGVPVPIRWRFAPLRDHASGRIHSVLACGDTTNVSDPT
jgi:PAS domain S-box-containing protein